MIDQLVNYVLNIAPFVSSLGGWVYVIVFGIAILESTPVIGTFTPGTLMLLFFGFLVSIADLHLVYCILAATLGAVIGDYIAYFLGRFGSRFFKEHTGLLRISHLEMGKAFFIKHGGKSILIGRFVGPIRPIVPMVAGAVRMSMRRFVPLNVSGALVWCSTLIVLGYITGDEWKKAEDVLSFIAIFGCIVIAVLVVRFALKRKNILSSKHEVGL